MKRNKYSKTKRIIAFIAAVAIAAALLLSALFIVENANHDCFHRDCLVCRQISSSLELLNSNAPKPEAVELFCKIAFLLILALVLEYGKIVYSTSITLKDKLLN